MGCYPFSGLYNTVRSFCVALCPTHVPRTQIVSLSRGLTRECSEVQLPYMVVSCLKIWITKYSHPGRLPFLLHALACSRIVPVFRPSRNTLYRFSRASCIDDGCTNLSYTP